MVYVPLKIWNYVESQVPGRFVNEILLNYQYVNLSILLLLVQEIFF